MKRYHDVTCTSGVMIPMRDGASLAADIYFPAREGSPLEGARPVILERTPYDRTAAERAKQCQFFARRGYIVVVQDLRGRFDSEGDLDPFGPADVPDGNDTCRWIAEQPWCDGQIATMGTSYASMNQAALAAGNPPALSAQFMNQGFSNHHDGRLRQGGALRQSMVAWLFRHATVSPEALADAPLKEVLHEADERVQQYLAHGPIRPGETPLRHLPTYEEHAVQITTRGELDEWWLRPGRWIDDSWKKVPDVPRYLASGWYDSHSHVISNAYQELVSHKDSPVNLLFGPWIHGSRTPEQPVSGEAHFGADAAVEFGEVHLAFFDEVMRGADAGVADAPPVRIFVMGGGSGRQIRSERETAVDVGGHWRYEKEWPLARTQYTPYYLHAYGELRDSIPCTSGGSTTYRYNPLDPVPTVGGPESSVSGLRMIPGAFDQRARPELGHENDLPLRSRPDVVTFETKQLGEGLEVTGPIEAVLYVSSSAPDTDFTVKLVDVYPENEDFADGLALNVTDGITRARYRKSYTKPQLLEPGEITQVRVSLPPTSLFFAPGHRLRVDISSSNWPRFDVNPNTGEPVGRHHRIEVANNTIHHSDTYPSHIILPVIPG